jgi:hypothetical protein
VEHFRRLNVLRVDAQAQEHTDKMMNLLHRSEASVFLKCDRLHFELLDETPMLIGVPYLHHRNNHQSQCADPAEERYRSCSCDILECIYRLCCVLENLVDCDSGGGGHH